MLACCIDIFFLDKNDDYDSVRSTLFFFHYSVKQTVAFLVTILTVFHFINEERKTFF